MSKVTINGVTYSGRNVVVSNGNVIIDGKPAKIADQKKILIRVEGDINMLEVDDCDDIQVGGNVGTLTSQNGNVKVKGSVTGSVSSHNGNIKCGGGIGGSVRTVNGNIKKGII